MKRRERQTATLLSVSESTVGTTLSADAASGATTLFVDDASVFDESGWLLVGSQVVKYAAIDDDAGTVTLADPLTSAAETDDFVARYSKLYGDVETVLSAQVAVLGDRDQGDELTVEVADWLDLPTGDRGGDGENCTIESDGDVWTLISASGRPSKARGWKWIWETPYTLTTADVSAGTVTIPLTYRPDSMSVELWWRRVLQDYGTDYTVNAVAQTVTLPLGSWCQAGDPVPIHYHYRSGLAKAVGPVEFTKAGAQMGWGFNWTSISWPSGALNSDLFLFAQFSRLAAVNTCTDARATLAASGQVNQINGVQNIAKVWVGRVTDTTTPLTAAATDLGAAQEDDYALVVLRPSSPIDWDLTRVADSGNQSSSTLPATPGVYSGFIPGLPGRGSGAVGVGFSSAGFGAASNHSWSAPWVIGNTSLVDYVGTYNFLSIAIQSSPVVPATPALTNQSWRGFAIGLGEG